jgi:hypothetical protein
MLNNDLVGSQVVQKEAFTCRHLNLGLSLAWNFGMNKLCRRGIYVNLQHEMCGDW